MSAITAAPRIDAIRAPFGAQALSYGVQGYDTTGKVFSDLTLREEAPGRFRLSGWTNSATDRDAWGNWNLIATSFGSSIEGHSYDFNRRLDVRIDTWSRMADIELTIRGRSGTERTYRFYLPAREGTW